VKLRGDGQIVEILEKPEHPPYPTRGCGVYLCRPEIFEHIRRTPVHPTRREREITYTIGELAGQGKAYGFKIDGYNFNVNDCEQLLRGSNMLSANRAPGIAPRSWQAVSDLEDPESMKGRAHA
jgi:dTDP-glucose pyrophosphorylase